MKVGDLVRNVHPESGFFDQVGIIIDVLNGITNAMLVKVIWQGQEFLWISKDCEVINEHR
jgi:hypothetical protein